MQLRKSIDRFRLMKGFSVTSSSSSAPLSLDASDDERVVLVPVALVDVHPTDVGNEIRATAKRLCTRSEAS